jgi:hypothetical protein
MKCSSLARISCLWIVGVTMVLAGCSTAGIGEVQQIVEVLLPATANLVTLITALRGNVSAQDLQMVQSSGSQVEGDLQLMQSLITQYQQADAVAQPGLLGQIQSLTRTVDGVLNGLLPATHIKDAATEAKVTAVVGVLLSEVQSIVEILPMENSDSVRTGRELALRPSPKKAPLSAKEFARSYNATMTAKTGNNSVDHTTAELRIHVHRRLARWASAGMLQ